MISEPQFGNSRINSRMTNIGLGRRTGGRELKFYYFASACLLAVVPLFLQQYEFSWLKGFLAVLLVLVCFYPSVKYLVTHEHSLPSLPIFCLAFALQFAFPVFIHDDTFILMGNETEVSSSKGSRRSSGDGNPRYRGTASWLLLASAKFLPTDYPGGASAPSEIESPYVLCPRRNLLSVPFYISRPNTRTVSAALIISLPSITEPSASGNWHSWVALLRSQRIKGLWCVALWPGHLGFNTGEFLQGFWSKRLFRWACSSLSSGYTLVAFQQRPSLLRSLSVVFLSPVKSDYRQLGSVEQSANASDYSSIATGAVWIQQAVEYWQDTLAGSRDLMEATSSASDRADFIHQVAHIYSLTPNEVPFQYGTTYSFFLVSFVPRAFWPDKPTAGSANSFYAVTYGVTSKKAPELRRSV